MSSGDAIPQTPIDEDTPGPLISVPDSGDTGEGGKIKMIVQLVKKCLGVKDIAAMRLSLPASLLEPIPNLEYWHYLDRPDMFAAINDSDDPFERMLAVLRFTFTKDLKFIGGVCKPYNSVLGEHFRAHWDVTPVAYSDDTSECPTPLIYTASSDASISAETTPSAIETDSVKSAKSSRSTRSGFSVKSKPGNSPSTAPTSPRQPVEITAQMSELSLTNGQSESPQLRVVFMTEQVSHHPPVSAYFASCPSRNLELVGIDQISAKVSGTTLRVGAGQFNKGIFVKITGGHGEGETYQITHPVAHVNGILRGSFYVTVSDSTIITCEGGKHGSKFRTIIEYKEQSWLGKPHFLLEGVIHTIPEGETDYHEWTKIKHVPQSRVVAAFDGSWRGIIRWRRVGLGSYRQLTSTAASSPVPSHVTLPNTSVSTAAASKSEISRHDEDYTTLIDLSTLNIVPKTVRPLEKQLPRESRKLWVNVTENLIKKEFSEATKQKVAIEQKQRDEAADRKRKGVNFVPRYFEEDLTRGYSNLTAEGWAAVTEELKEDPSSHIESSQNNKATS